MLIINCVCGVFFTKHTNIISFAAIASSALAMLMLILCFATSDFSVLNVVNNSHTLKPMIYKISAAWGNHEGSLLLWIFSLSFFTFVFNKFTHSKSKLNTYTLQIQFFLIMFFTLFVFFSSNPFERIFPAPIDGYGLNPILQDIGLAMHPPMLYLGYVGFSVAYSATIAALLSNSVNALYAATIRPWILLSFSFLTIGIGLGSWWAYRELGWGGYWFWDPVENASLIPWLCSVALIHATFSFQKYESMKHWTVLLGIATFTVSMIGTFLVRSNLITSVHAFANDPSRGLIILGFIFCVTLIALILYAIKSPSILSKDDKRLMSINNFIFAFAAFVVLFGTIYPLALDLICNKKISVGAPYFNCFAKILSFVALGVFGSYFASKHKKLILCITLILLALHMIFEHQILIYSAICGLAAYASFIIFATNKMTNHSKVSHFGFVLLVFTLFTNSFFSKEIELSMKVNDSVEFYGHKFTLEDINLEQGKNYLSRYALFKVQKDGMVKYLKPETRFFPIEKQQTIEADKIHYLLYDMYISTGDLENQLLSVRIYSNIFVSFICISCFLIFFGGIYSLLIYFKKQQYVRVSNLYKRAGK